MAVGRKWVLLARTMDGGFFDGYVAIRLSDIGEVVHRPSFEEGFARTRPEWPPRLPDGASVVDLDTTRGVLASFAACARLVGIERDRKYEAAWIGVPFEIAKKWLWLWEVDPRARWHDQPRGYRLRSITTVVLDDHYQRGLAAMAGSPPAECRRIEASMIVDGLSSTGAGLAD